MASSTAMLALPSSSGGGVMATRSASSLRPPSALATPPRSGLPREGELSTARSNLTRAQRETEALAEDMEQIRGQLRSMKVGLSTPKSFPAPAPAASAASPFVAAAAAPLAGLRDYEGGVLQSALDSKVVSRVFDGLEKVRMDLDTEVKHRMAHGTEAMSRTEVLKETLTAKSAEQAEIQREVAQLRVTLQTLSTQLETLREALDTEVAARNSAQEALLSSARELHEASRREAQSRSEELAQALRAEAEDRAKALRAEGEGRALLAEELGKAVHKEGQDGIERVEELSRTVRKEAQLHSARVEELGCALRKEVQEGSAHMRGLVKTAEVAVHSLREQLHREQTERESAGTSLRAELLRQMLADRETVAGMATRLQEVEAAVASEGVFGAQLKYLETAAEEEANKRSAAIQQLEHRCAKFSSTAELKQLEQRFETLSASIEMKHAALASDVEHQVKSMRQAVESQLEAGLAKVVRDFASKTSEDAQARQEALLARDRQAEVQLEGLRLQHKALHEPLAARVVVLERRQEELASAGRGYEATRSALEAMQEAVARERSARETVVQQLQASEKIARTERKDWEVGLESRVGALWTQIDEFEKRQLRELAARTQDHEAANSRLSESLSRQIREVQELLTRLEGRISDDRAQSGAMVERVAAVEGYLQHIRSTFSARP